MNDQTGGTGAGGAGLAAQAEDSAPGNVTLTVRARHLNQLVSAVSAPASALSGTDGQLRRGGAQGLFVQDYRALSHLVLTVNEEEPVPLGYEAAGGSVNEFHYALSGVGNRGPDPTIFLHRARTVEPTGMIEHFTFASRAGIGARLQVGIAAAADLGGLQALRGGTVAPERRAQPDGDEDGLVWREEGGCATHLTGRPRPATVEPQAGRVAWELTLAPGEVKELDVTVRFEDDGAYTVFIPTTGEWPAPLDRHLADQVGDPRLRRLVEVSVADLDKLRMSLARDPSNPFVAAGVPWYLALFGRDSIWTARMLLPLGTDLALGTLRTLAGLQGRRADHGTGEQPGKILHEVRRTGLPGRPGSIATSEDGGPWPPVPTYYGTVDATPLWVCLLHETWRRGASPADVEPLLAPLERSLEWLAGPALDSRGFVSYIDESGAGLANQGWKDSRDAVQSRLGRRAAPPIALCEVQGYAYQAAMGGAELLEAFGRPGPDRWHDFADGIRQRFARHFWVEDDAGPYPALALDGSGVPVDAVASNMGHLLATGLLNQDEAELVTGRLAGADLNSGFGLRTMAASSAGFNPLSYHCGSVWPHDTAISILGLAHDGRPAAREAAASLVEGLLRAAEHFEYRLPELYGGHSRDEVGRPLAYPDACCPQAWAAAASVAILGVSARL